MEGGVEEVWRENGKRFEINMKNFHEKVIKTG